MSDNIHEQQDFFDKVVINDDGTLAVANVPKTGTEYNPNTAFDFFNKVALDENGNIKTFI